MTTAPEPDLIDITDPFVWGIFADERGYVHYNVYRDDEPKAGPAYKAALPLNAPDSQFLGGERVVDGDCMLRGYIRMENGLTAVLVSYPEL